MRDFFASLRRMLAYVDLERMNLGAVAQQFITDEILPRLEKKLAVARTDNDKARIGALIEEYGKYANPRNPEGKIYSKTAANIVRTLAQRAKLGEDETEDLMQKLALDFFQPLRAGGNDLRDVLTKFDEMGGPLALNRLWMHVVDLRTRYHIREVIRLYKEKTYDLRENEEGEELDPISQVPAPSRVDEGYIQQVMKDLSEYIHSKVKNPKIVEIFDRWFELAQEKGADKVDMKHDVFMPMTEEGRLSIIRKGVPTNTTYSTFNEQWIGVKRLIVQFFEKELGGEVVPKIKRVLHLSSAEILAYEEFRRRLAVWMLGGTLRGTIEAKEQD